MYNKKFLKRLSALVVMTVCLTGCSPTVDKPCDWCRSTPSVAYKTKDGSDAYVCKECSSKCMLCNKEKATKHYENLVGTIVFVCSDCYGAGN